MKKLLIPAALFLSIVALPAGATSTGLNNIPTADLVPEGTLVYQWFSNLANNSKPGHFTGFKYGLMQNIEIGLDGRVFPEKAAAYNKCYAVLVQR